MVSSNEMTWVRPVLGPRLAFRWVTNWNPLVPLRRIFHQYLERTRFSNLVDPRGTASRSHLSPDALAPNPSPSRLSLLLSRLCQVWRFSSLVFPSGQRLGSSPPSSMPLSLPIEVVVSPHHRSGRRRGAAPLYLVLWTSATCACLVVVAYSGPAGGCGSDLIYGMGGGDHANRSAAGQLRPDLPEGRQSLPSWCRVVAT